jgi:hypothetical protein
LQEGSTPNGILHKNQNQNPQNHQVSFFNLKNRLGNKLDCNSYPTVKKTKQNLAKTQLHEAYC